MSKEEPSAAQQKPATRAFVASLKLTGFRNYASLVVAFAGRPVVLTGPNGAGKTNLMEAVSFLSPGRGLRRARLEDVPRRPGDGTFAIAARVENAAGTVDLGTGIAPGAGGPEARRAIRVNRAPARSAEALLEHLRVLWLTPSMDGLFTGPASDRRRFLDRAVLAIDRHHGSRVARFEKAMRGRNRLLSEPAPDGRWLDAIEAEMAEIGVAIAAARREWLALAAGLIAATAADSPFPRAAVALDGELEAALDGGRSAAVEDGYRARLAEGRARDAAAGRTLSGPHATDLLVRHGPKDVPAEACSTGEQKALLVGLVLAQSRLVAGVTGETPVVLLDEIAAHLDEARRHALFAVLLDLGCQAFMTGTDAGVFDALGPAAEHLAVSGGTVTPAG
ncbi:MAG TPA: DNA replication/repair protein RecF [Bauldia sp.]|nr:DNA replication/repair protein RecF [Bauldia sp.]